MLMHRRNTRVRTAALAAALVAAVLSLGGCDDGGDGAKAGADEGPSVVAPGKPGEPARTLSADEAVKAAGDDTPTPPTSATRA